MNGEEGGGVVVWDLELREDVTLRQRGEKYRSFNMTFVLAAVTL